MLGHFNQIMGQIINCYDLQTKIVIRELGETPSLWVSFSFVGDAHKLRWVSLMLELTIKPEPVLVPGIQQPYPMVRLFGTFQHSFWHNQFK